MKCLRWLLINSGVILGVALLPQAAGAECFKPLPLNDLASRDIGYFKDLAEWKSPIGKAKEVERFLPPDSGVGPEVNIDFYYVVFKRPSNKTLSEVFKDIRLHFGEFTRGATADYDFEPYGKFFEISSYAEENLKKWEADDPTGALMNFKLDTMFPNPKTSFETTGFNFFRVFKFAHPWGGVQATCASSTDFIFSTVDTVRGLAHPVAGNRGFGIRDANNGNWMFYSKAVDRESDSIYNNKYVKRKTLFCYGHLFWLDFYSNMKDYLNGNGMPVEKVVVTNRGTAWWPLSPNGPPPNEPNCE